MKKQLEENIDYYYNEQGYVVLTEKYHRERGYCCGNGCLHCPFDYENVAEDKKSRLLAARKAQKGA
jgi:hypothetical protein